MDKTVRRYWWDPGRNSRKMALSTGKLPPTPKDANGSEVGTTGCNHAEDSSNSNRQVEGPSPTEDVAAKTPKDSAEKETNILGESEELLTVSFVDSVGLIL
jgi:hypothetical protein